MKVRFIKDYGSYKQDEVTELTPNEAHGLIELGVARIDKMLTEYRTTTELPRKRYGNS